MNSPSKAVTLQPTEALLTSLNQAISDEQKKIDAFNARIKDKQTHLDAIKDRFWVWLRSACEPHLAAFVTQDQMLSAKRQNEKDEILKIRSEVAAQREIIAQ